MRRTLVLVPGGAVVGGNEANRYIHLVCAMYTIDGSIMCRILLFGDTRNWLVINIFLIYGLDLALVVTHSQGLVHSKHQ